MGRKKSEKSLSCAHGKGENKKKKSLGGKTSLLPTGMIYRLSQKCCDTREKAQREAA